MSVKYGKFGEVSGSALYGLGGIESGSKIYSDVVAAVLEGMKLNVNANWLSTYDGTVQLANVLQSAQYWTQEVGVGAWTHARGGFLTATVSTDEFRAKISDVGLAIPTGTYTFFNPGGHEIGFGGAGDQNEQAYTTATTGTFTYASGGLYLWSRGSCNTAGTALIIPGHVTSWQAGNPWNDDYITFLNSLELTGYRTMNMNKASANYEQDWSDRMLTDDIIWYDKIIAWEFLFDLANRTNIDMWYCIPTRATDAYTTSWAQLALADLDASRSCYVELSNEIWNYGDPWRDGSQWINYLNHTRHDITPIPVSDSFTWTAHGLTANEPLICFTRLENYYSGSAVEFQMRAGGTAYAGIVDVDTIQLLDAASGTPIVVNDGHAAQTVVRANDAAAAMNTNYGLRSVAIWDIIEAHLAPARVKKVIATQQTNPAMTTDRFAATGVAGRADFSSPAPYFYGEWWGTQVDLVTTACTPKVWIPDTGYTVYMGLYANGSTPTDNEIKTGTGAGYIASESITSTVGAGWDSFTQITGLVDTTDYEIFYIFVTGGEWRIQLPFTQAASGSTTGLEPYAQTTIRNRISIAAKLGEIADHIINSGDTSMACYECNNHFHESAPAELEAWRLLYAESSELLSTMDYYYRSLAAAGVAEAYHYKEGSSVDSKIWPIVSTYTDLTDPRYLNRIAFGTNVVPQSPILITDDTSEQLTDPGSFPHVVHTFVDSSLTYTNVSGNEYNRYDINGNNIRLLNDTGVDWASPSTDSLLIEGSDGVLSDFFTLSVNLGDAWYAADAYLAFDTIADIDTAVVNPVLGPSVALSAGTGATATAGLWNMLGTNDYIATGLSPSSNLSTAWLAALAIDLNGYSTGATTLWRLDFGNTTISLYVTFSAIIFRVYTAASGNTDISLGSPASFAAGTKYALWCYYDADSGTPQIHAGINQTDSGSAAKDLTGASTGSFEYNMGLVSASIDSKYGSQELLLRSGLTLTQAKALVQKLQDHHSI